MKLPIDNLPTSNVILGYKNLLGKDAPSDRLSLIRHLSKDHIIAELAGLNYRLKGSFSKEVDSKLSSQERELFYFCGKNRHQYDKYVILINKLTDGKKTNLFNRQSCMFGIEEVLRSDIHVIADYQMSPPVWEPFLQYMLCVNEYITQMRKSKEGETATFELLNPRLIPLSESVLLNDPLYIMYRGLMLMDYFAMDNETKDHLKTYFTDTYTIPYERFIFELFQMFFANENQYKHLNFYYVVPGDHPVRYLFDVLSKRYDKEDCSKLLDIRKSPFYDRGKGHYVVTDKSMLLDKAYQQFINDFWFDYLKEKTKKNGKPFKFQGHKAIIESGNSLQEKIAPEAAIKTNQWTGYTPSKANFPNLKQEKSDKGKRHPLMHRQIMIFKAWLRGIHYHCDHLQRYIDEFCYRYNCLKYPETLFHNVVKTMIGAAPLYLQKSWII